MSKNHPRAKGAGSVFPLANGKWRGQVEAGWTKSGARRYVTVTAATEKAAARALQAKQNEIAKNGIPQAGATAWTIKRWSEVWLPIYQQKVRPTRWTDARGVVRRYIVPSIGGQRLGTLTPAHVRAVHKAVDDAGFGQATALRSHDVLMVMLKAAQREGITVPGNVLMVERPKLGESDRDAIPMDDALAILKAATERPDVSRWVAAFLQGMRQGECLGLTWECVDLERGTLDISWQLQRLPYLDRAAETFRVPKDYTCRRLVGATHLVRPKSKKGTRIIPLVKPMSDALAAWRESLEPNAYGLVWPEADGRPTRKITDRSAWFGLQDEAQVARVDGTVGRRYGLHEARHTTATLLLELGVDPHAVTAIMGHSSITVSRGYQHVSQVLARQGLEGVAERLQLGR